MHASYADIFGKLEKFLIRGEKLQRKKKFAVSCGLVNEPLCAFKTSGLLHLTFCYHYKRNDFLLLQKEDLSVSH